MVLAGVLAIGAPNAGIGAAHEERRYGRLHEVEQATLGLPSRQRAAAIEDTYEELFPERTVDDVGNMSDDALAFGFRAALTVHFYAPNESSLERMSDHLSEMERLGIAEDEMRESFYRGLIGSREFDRAAAYLSRHPGLQVEPVPEVAAAGYPADPAPSVYRTDPDEPKLLREHVRVDRGVVVIAVVHPLCGPSRRAMETILEDRTLLDAMKGAVHWVTPQATRLHFASLQAWNRGRPDIQIKLTHDAREWPGIDDWSTPHFYLLRDGELLDEFMGWPNDEGGRHRLMELLERGELL